ncbi:unnamed protein product [Ranitomeya imitator]|uniref:Protein kinase domain-containing protein n=1 Tax=Ranitomeya imitator TaxID=111125 RepID=A0ABN9M3U2_9NEOB|nr:unnamed protein product [Ranitomeya imitator]
MHFGTNLPAGRFGGRTAHAPAILQDGGAQGEDGRTDTGTPAPEVLSGGPYSHSADWFSFGVLLFALASGEFPVASTIDHMSMLERVNDASYDVPETVSQSLSHLLTELLCKVPRQRLRYLHQFKSHIFFRGMTFDPARLQKFPVDLVITMRKSEVAVPSDFGGFEDFECDLTQTLQFPCPA